MNYKNPWERKQEMAAKAVKHTEHMNKTYPSEIQKAIENTSVFSGQVDDVPSVPFYDDACKTAVFQCDSLEAAILLENTNEKDIMILNFASYKHPGGMFLKGSMAQEEALCHESILFDVLKVFQDKYYNINKKRLNRSLYTDRALFSKDILFIRDKKQHEFSVLTCAAPNYGSAMKYSHISRQENHEALKQRIDFIFRIAIHQHVSSLVLGAWGCGVFGQNPEEVASLFMYFAEKYRFYFKNIVFAVPQSNSNANYDAFLDTVVNGKRFRY